VSATVDLYDNSYAHYAGRLYEEVRRETYGEDLGQTGWMTASELERFARLLRIDGESRVLEVGCGAGGCALQLARKHGAAVTAIDLNESGIRNARELARAASLDTRLQFEIVDASSPLPFADASFDAIFSNDAMCHIPHRLEVLRDWHRLLKPNGRMLFTDAMIVTGLLSNAEIAARSSIGFYVFPPPGENERLIEAAGLELLTAENVTDLEAEISLRWREARERRREGLIAVEGGPTFEGLQNFLACVHQLSAEARLSRYLYLAERRRDD
jgi:SAM-dependent methyltransferase